MSVVAIDKTRPFTIETGWVIIHTLGIPDEYLAGMLSSKELRAFKVWRNQIDREQPHATGKETGELRP